LVRYHPDTHRDRLIDRLTQTHKDGAHTIMALNSLCWCSVTHLARTIWL